MLGELEARIAELRETIRQRPAASKLASCEPLSTDLRSLHDLYDVSEAPFSFHRQVLGRLLLPLRWLVKELLTPVIAQQVRYNAANTRLVDDLKGRLDTLQTQAAALARRNLELEKLVPEALAVAAEQFRAQSQALGRTFARRYGNDREIQERSWRELGDRSDRNAQRVEQLERETQNAAHHLSDELRNLHKLIENFTRQAGGDTKTLAARMARAERRLRRMSETAEITAAGDEASLQSSPQDPAIDYFEFQQRFRGAEDEVRERQATYRPYFANRQTLVDLGCGRGEFLELMRADGICAIGIDSDADMVAYCRGKGLEAVHDDANRFLARQADESLGAIFSAQMAEHVSAAELARMLTLAARKLRPGGVLVVETLNPESIWVHYRWFWMDPTHTRLVHPQTLKFLLEAAGLSEVECHFLPPPEGPLLIPPLPKDVAGAEQFNRATGYLNQILFGSQEYFVVGTRSPD
jgi:2-polyprenyl-3-methyl-5-hydroxy-6-metoxy-1,4-benzoquinol methylase